MTSLKTNMEVLTKQLKNLNTSKSMGPDGCHPRLLRETADIVYIPLQKIFDKTFEEGCVPSLWKDAHDRLLLKLKRYGFDGQLLNWVKDFLSGRRQRVMLNGKRKMFRMENSHIWCAPGLSPGAYSLHNICK